jgi:hypothetical protein
MANLAILVPADFHRTLVNAVKEVSRVVLVIVLHFQVNRPGYCHPAIVDPVPNLHQIVLADFEPVSPGKSLALTVILVDNADIKGVISWLGINFRDVTSAIQMFHLQPNSPWNLHGFVTDSIEDVGHVFGHAK